MVQWIISQPVRCFQIYTFLKGLFYVDIFPIIFWFDVIFCYLFFKLIMVQFYLYLRTFWFLSAIQMFIRAKKIWERLGIFTKQKPSVMLMAKWLKAITPLLFLFSVWHKDTWFVVQLGLAPNIFTLHRWIFLLHLTFV